MLKNNHRSPHKDLGNFIVEYRDRPLTWRDLVCYFTPAAAAALLPWAYGSWRSWYGSLHYGPAAAESWGLPWYLLSALATLSLLALAWMRLRQAGRWVRLYRNGLVIHTRFGRRKTLPWQELNGIAYQASELTIFGRVYQARQHLSLYTHQDRRVVIDRRLSDITDLAARVKARLYPHLLPQFRQAFSQGQTLIFGRLALNIDQLWLQGKGYAWHEIVHLELSSGHLVVELHNQHSIKIPAKKIPNLELFLQLIQEGVKA